MSRFRFSLLHFLIVITLLSGALAAMASQSRVAASIVLNVYVGFLCLSLAGAILARGQSRAFWLGFAIFGWVYYLVGFESVPNSTPQRYASMWIGGLSYNDYGSEPASGSRLLTSELVDLLEDNMLGSRQVGAKVMAQWNGGSFYSGVIKSWDGTNYVVAWDDGSTPSAVAPAAIRGYTPYIRTSAHSLFGAIIGLVGGVLSVSFFGGTTAAQHRDSNAAQDNANARGPNAASGDLRGESPATTNPLEPPRASP